MFLFLIPLILYLSTLGTIWGFFFAIEVTWLMLVLVVSKEQLINYVTANLLLSVLFLAGLILNNNIIILIILLCKLGFFPFSLYFFNIVIGSSYRFIIMDMVSKFLYLNALTMLGTINLLSNPFLLVFIFINVLSIIIFLNYINNFKALIFTSSIVFFTLTWPIIFINSTLFLLFVAIYISINIIIIFYLSEQGPA